ncbi:hypothetical protein PHMEG_00021073 [Phytophthora megakarya]|uniref:PiggyBac transposable element-derived protein domain-containing protein n=1 Tax=Phytophthora megakarya TaxID=4795 RepID=A0A225VNG5_9STRA|nr:hypothetical protein PHMEG_00021073 [Phytophthora megakarya]
MPIRENLPNHWRQDDVGAILRSILRRILVRDRFMDSSRYLHFNNNKDPRAKTDCALKSRSVVSAPQETFVKSFVHAELSFDEAMLPSSLRIIGPEYKPQKWDTKLFMFCYARSVYCNCFEIYCGQKQRITESGAVDLKSGPAAVIRTLRAIFAIKPLDSGHYGACRLRLVLHFQRVGRSIIDLGFYTVGTILTNGRGFCKAVVSKKKKRPKNIPRGTLIFARSKLVNNISAVCWWDSEPVHFLSVGGNLALYCRYRASRSSKTLTSLGAALLSMINFVCNDIQLRAITYRKYCGGEGSAKSARVLDPACHCAQDTD